MSNPEVFFERLTALDSAFLAAERGGVHMHIASLMRFSESPVCSADGGVDFETLQGHTLDMIEGEPRLRQRLAWTPVLRHPYWVDDPHFRLSFHLRHAALPRPGDDRQLKRLMARIVSQRLDRERPLWEQWIVEGLADGGFAIIHKFHHCMLDGMAAMGLLARLVKGEPGSRQIPDARPLPSGMQLLEAEAKHRGGAIASLTGALLEDGEDHVRGQRRESVAAGARAFSETLFSRAARTRINPVHLGEQRRFEMLSLPIAGVRSVKKAQRTTQNDIVLAIVTAALRAYLERTGVDPATLKPFRAMVPISTGGKHAKKKLGNAIAMMIADLPLDEADPVAQLRQIHETTERFKAEGHEVDSTQWVSELDDQLGLGLLGSAFRWGGKLRPYNVLVTNVPGPPRAVKLFGAPLTAMYGAVPLLEQQGLGIAVFSYARQLHFGLQADFDAIEDLELLVEDLRKAHDALCEAATQVPEPVRAEEPQAEKPQAEEPQAEEPESSPRT